MSPVDGDYTGNDFSGSGEAHLNAKMTVAKRNKLHMFIWCYRNDGSLNVHGVG